MSVEHYGIYIDYAPTIDLRGEGLGRHLSNFLKGADKLDNVRFVLLCPSWTVDALKQLFEAENVPLNKVDIISPKGKPFLLRVFESISERKYTRKSLGMKNYISDQIYKVFWTFVQNVASIYNLKSLLKALIKSLPLVLRGSVFLLFYIIIATCGLVSHITKRLWRRISPTSSTYSAILARLAAIINAPDNDSIVLKAYKYMHNKETSRMQDLISRLDHVKAWYSPTSFTPSFNDINAPSLLCVPDVVLNEFSIGFSKVGGDRFLETFESIKKAIWSAGHIVTYSQYVKWKVLVDNYGIPANRISVVRHAPENLSQLVTPQGVQDTEEATLEYCRQLFSRALQKSPNPLYASGFKNTQVNFIFYPSQFRPNKNILTLLRAYNYLLRRRYIGHKLILTGRLDTAPEVNSYISNNRLENDVLCLSRLSPAELAACYKLADLAINPSLSEGGCPFTFSEALSVDTPVVAARIDVTMEMFSEYDLHEKAFFDPYGWEDIVEKATWALENRQNLLDSQKLFYHKLMKRDWCDVAREYVEILDKISEQKTAHL